MVLPLAFGILSHFDAQKAHKTYIFLLLGIAYSVSISGLRMLVWSPPNAIAVAHLALAFFWMKWGIFVMLAMMLFLLGSPGSSL